MDQNSNVVVDVLGGGVYRDGRELIVAFEDTVVAGEARVVGEWMIGGGDVPVEALGVCDLIVVPQNT